jgi:glycolate oxidase FAD binding subunit
MVYSDVLGVEPGEIINAVTTDVSTGVLGEQVAAANSNGKAVIPWGGGTGQTFGYLPRRADILLNLLGLNRILAHEFADLTVTVQAGVTLSAVQEQLAQHNQYLPLDPLHPGKATIGGIIACNAFGPSVVGSGSVRDWLIGIAVMDAQGRLIRGGGKVVKNVTGYDLPKIHVGALGTLGIVVEATFKVAPRPDSTRVAVFTCVNPELSLRLHTETAPAMSVLRSTTNGAVLATLYSGLAAVVESEIGRAARIAGEAGEVGLSALPTEMPSPFSDSIPDAPLVLRFSGPRADAAERHNAIADLADWEMVDTFPGNGQTMAYLRPKSDPQKALQHCRTWANNRHVSLTVVHAPPAMRRTGTMLWSPLPASLPIMRRLKETLDPNGTLNPGRFVGEI